jgi:hypothetical protein
MKIIDDIRCKTTGYWMSWYVQLSRQNFWCQLPGSRTKKVHQKLVCEALYALWYLQIDTVYLGTLFGEVVVLEGAFSFIAIG